MSMQDKTPSITMRRSALSRARGLGSAKSGAAHWWAERMTAAALLPLSLYFVVSVIILLGADRAHMAAYMAEPWNSALFLALIVIMFYHLSMGVQVVIEDYVPNEAKRLLALLVVKGVIIFLALASAVSVLKLAFS
ncbi:succinate dehydrogenase, hydrophobic membrane anchor protein [Acidocella sp.]|uniref:succinate dehydrogenase, hydrophobic membrane anchor protein n=1 Tax=Acidocella sp. TaxID=50710 RepID=UPI003CFFFE57